MKIALTTQWDDAFAQVAKLTIPIMQEYCLRWGYSFHALHFQNGDVIKARSRVIAKLLPEYDIVVHVDADCLLTNLAMSICDVQEIGSRWNVSASGNGGQINDGVCIWRKSETTEIFLNNHIAGKYGDVILQDAVAMEPSLIVRNPSCQKINACLPEEYDPVMPEYTRWTKGSFCLHLLAMDNERRVRLISEHLNQIIRLSSLLKNN